MGPTWKEIKFISIIGKPNQIPISTLEVQVTAAPISPCRSMTPRENLTEVRSVRTNRLNVLSQPISDSLRMNTILSSGAAAIRHLLRQSPSRVVVRYPHHAPLQWAE